MAELANISDPDDGAGLPTPHSNPEKVRCKQCHHQMYANASQCNHCGSYQNWRRHVTVGNALIGVLVGALFLIGESVDWSTKLNAEDRPSFEISQMVLKGPKNDGEIAGPSNPLEFQATIENNTNKSALIRNLGALKIENRIILFDVPEDKTWLDVGRKRVVVTGRFAYPFEFEAAEHLSDQFDKGVDIRSRLREAPNGTSFPAIVEIQDGKLKFVRFSPPDEKITDAIYRIYHQCEHLVIAEKVADDDLAACKAPVEIDPDELGV